MYSFHNTLNAKGPELDLYEARAQTQDQRILDWFRTYEQPASPSYVCRVVFHDQVPITSVRRAMTNLTNQKLLRKTDRQVKGRYGKPEYQWALWESLL